MAQLMFLGAARTVTGSKYLLDTGGVQVLFDCGLFQGLKNLRERNWLPLPVDARAIEAVVLTHAHLDHVGYLPRLVRQGFRGRVFCTTGTADLCRLVLPDAGRLQEEDARAANRGGYTRHAPALPLFDEADAFRALTQLQPAGYHRTLPVAKGLEVSFTPAGHLLGAAAVTATLTASGRRIVFGGDLGRYDRPVLRDPEPVEDADVLLVESTYGNRMHEDGDDGRELGALVKSTIQGGGRVVVPAFAIGRVEEVLYWLRKLEDERAIPSVPVYLDSPMATEALQFYARHVRELDDEMRGQGKPIASFVTDRFQSVSSAQQSSALVAGGGPAVIISSSGMATGGRVLHHLKRVLPDPKNTVVFVGFQAPGTRGRALVDGAREVKIHGQLVPVAARIARLDSMSAHADAGEMIRWLRGFRQAPRQTFIVHGETDASEAMQAAISRELGWHARIPEYRESVELD